MITTKFDTIIDTADNQKYLILINVETGIIVSRCQLYEGLHTPICIKTNDDLVSLSAYKYLLEAIPEWKNL